MRSISSRPRIDSLAGVVEHAIFCVEILNGRAPACGVVFTEDFLKIAGQQSRYAVGHGLSDSPFLMSNLALGAAHEFTMCLPTKGSKKIAVNTGCRNQHADLAFSEAGKLTRAQAENFVACRPATSLASAIWSRESEPKYVCA